jgi:hypothetical protein
MEMLLFMVQAAVAVAEEWVTLLETQALVELVELMLAMVVAEVRLVILLLPILAAIQPMQTQAVEAEAQVEATLPQAVALAVQA